MSTSPPQPISVDDRRALRLRALGAAELFSTLPPESLARVAGVASEVSFAEGALAVREGDHEEDLYVVVRGDLQVFVTRLDGGELVLSQLGPGEIFGEAALYTDGGRRNASVRCRSRAELLRVAAADYRKLVERHPEIERALRRRGEAHDADRASRLAHLSSVLGQEAPPPSGGTRYAAGTVVYREGTPADAFYFILSGTAAVYREATPSETSLLRPGQGFGEQALVGDAPRDASVRAETDLEVQVVSRDQFLKSGEQSAAQRDHMAALSFVCPLPGRGVALQWAGRRADQPSVERAYRLDDGTTWTSTFLVGGNVFRLEETSAGAPAPAGGAATEHVWFDAQSGLSRTVRLDGRGRVTRLFGVGGWGRLPELVQAALHGTALERAAFASFAATGAVYLPPPHREIAAESITSHRLICFCMQVPRGAIRRELRAGARTFEALRTRTGCGSVCGGCEPSVKELLGHAAWTPVTATAIPISDELRCFRLYPQGGAAPPFVPGQHVVVEGYIEGYWVARSYTITSSPQVTEYLEICVRREPEGLFSRWLFGGNLDEKALHISAPRGDVRWQPGERPTVCLVAGIGVTPALAIVRAAVAAGRAERVHVDYSAPRRSQLAFLDELEAAAAEHQGITVRARATRVEGRLRADEVAALRRKFPDADFHLCGPQPYMAAVRRALLAAGVAAARVKLEVFVHAGSPGAPTAPQEEATLFVGRRRRPPRRRVLGVVLGALVTAALLAGYLAVHFFTR